MSKRYAMRVYFEELGGHTHLQIFTGSTNFGKAGDLVMTNEEFAAWRDGEVQMEWCRRTPVQAKEGQSQ